MVIDVTLASTVVPEPMNIFVVEILMLSTEAYFNCLINSGLSSFFLTFYSLIDSLIGLASTGTLSFYSLNGAL